MSLTTNQELCYNGFVHGWGVCYIGCGIFEARIWLESKSSLGRILFIHHFGVTFFKKCFDTFFCIVSFEGLSEILSFEFESLFKWHV